MNYQRRDERLPDVLVFNGDILHGILKHTSANAQYTAKTPAELRAEEARIRTRTDLDAMTKEQAIADLYRESLGQLNVTNLAKQREEFIYTFKPYCMDVLRNGGKIVLVSGNHFNKTTKSAGGEAIDDEAYALAQLLDGYEKYKAEGKIIILDGLGEEYGIGTMPLGDGKELYAVHEPGRGSDPALALMRKLKNEDRTPHLALSGHLHVPTIGFANGRLALQYPGMQSWSKYLTLFSAKASLRGKINVEVDPRRQWARVRGIYDPTLERPEYR
jgi:calcineurin-like phosphoesterase family protein